MEKPVPTSYAAKPAKRCHPNRSSRPMLPGPGTLAQFRPLARLALQDQFKLHTRKIVSSGSRFISGLLR